jgi:DeoR/GlpR family transcriptional regulator of sugar metabolism
MTDNREQHIIDFVESQGECSSKEIFEAISISVSYATLKRILAELVAENYLSVKGRGRGTKYIVSPAYKLIQPVDIDEYFNKEIDEREIKESFDFSIIEVLAKTVVFSKN